MGVYSDGFIHAGNFAYLSLVSLFAFCVVAAAIAGAFGQTESGLALIEAFLKRYRQASPARCKDPSSPP
jgi:membrane protein